MAFTVAYDPRWPVDFAAEARVLEPVLRPWLSGAVEHIGSTAIPGMTAKPVLDMMAPVASLDDAAAASDALGRLGYLVRPHRVDAVAYVRAADGHDTHHLHLTTVTSDLWQERLAFRDALRGDERLAQRYRDLKARLLSEDPDGYTGADKRAFVREVLAGCGVALRDDRHVAPT